MSELNHTSSTPANANAADQIDAMTLAAWTNGQTSDAENQRVEAWLAENPQAMEEMLTLHQSKDQPEVAMIPATQINALQMAVSDAIETQAPASIKLADHPLALITRHWKQWSATAAAVVVLGLAGFWMGGAFAGSRVASVADGVEAQTIALSEMLEQYNTMNLNDPVLPGASEVDEDSSAGMQSMLDLLDEMETAQVSISDYEPALMMLNMDIDSLEDEELTMMALQEMLYTEGDA